MKNEEILRLLANGELEGLSEDDVQTVTLNLLLAIQILIKEYIILYEGELSPIKNYNKLIDMLLIDSEGGIDLGYIIECTKRMLTI